MSARLVKWHRTHPGAGTTFSKDGRFAIRPNAFGHEGRPVFALIDFKDQGALRTYPSQAKAKADAEKIVKAEEAQRIIAFAADLEREKRERER